MFGRKINQAENQLAFIEFLRLIADGVIEPVEAVKAYHSVLQKLGVTPIRPLELDLTFQTAVMSYGGSSTTISIPAMTPSPPPPPAAAVTPPAQAESKVAPSDKPDFGKMTSAERLQYHLDRLKRSLG